MRYALNTVAINGWATKYGYGTATMALHLSGIDSSQKSGSGIATMSVFASGSGTRAKTGSATATMRIEGFGGGKIARTGRGEAVLQLRGWHGIPIPCPTPDVFWPTHPSRVVNVGPDVYVAPVEQDFRAAAVLHEDRTLYVTKDR